MSQPFNVNPEDLLVAANGHLYDITRLGQVIDLTPEVGGGVWASQAAVAERHASTATLTAGMMTQLGQHANGLTAAAGTYQAQEGVSAGSLKETVGMVTGIMKDVEAPVADVLKTGTQVMSNAVQAVGSFGQAAATGASQFIGPMATATSTQAAPHANTEGQDHADPSADSHLESSAGRGRPLGEHGTDV